MNSFSSFSSTHSSPLRNSKILHGAFLAAVVVRLIYWAGFHDQMTAFGYEVFFSMQAVNLLNGQGMTVNDEHDKLIDKDAKIKIRGGLLDPKDWPPNPNPQANYYTAFETPGYTWFLALIWSLFPATYAVPKLIQAILSASMVYPIFGISRRLFGIRPGLIAAFLYAFCLPSAYLSQMASKEAWEPLFIIMIVWLAIAQWQNARLWRQILLICMVILSVFFRGNLLLFMGMLCVAAVPWIGFRAAMRFAIIIYLFVFLALIPWYLRNKHFVGHSVWLKENFYLTLYCGFYEYDKSFVDLASEPHPTQEMIRNSFYFNQRLKADGTPARVQDDWDVSAKPIVLRVLRDRPLWYAGTVVRRFLKTPWMPLDWGSEYFEPSSRSFAAFHQQTGQGRFAYLLKYPAMVAYKYSSRLWECLLAPLSLLALWQRRDLWRYWLVVAAVYYGFALTYAPLHVESRYMVPHMWALLILAAVAIDSLFSRYTRRQSNFPVNL